ncbi:hypothetical protein BDP55DRAFT_629324 [Colletotrichum godetiae]|uniref:Uncharacterized protein n=1 Tax=Colletotrichum godetiae TaxID=1209918 RepID=A0AAJ0F0R3_9PEZI|nr:uncharacterized protein BDP55DRAFT_629324 [Colletotrichum godetiae]KAK1688768.1 hypothetical protein BDP55DRAFT_629324 [Colletotrichum godetiae]
MTTTPHHPQSRPRATPARIYIRLRDRLELLLERFVDGDPTAQAGFRSYKAHRNARRLEKDGGPASTALAVVSNANDGEPRRLKGPIEQGNQCCEVGLPREDGGESPAGLVLPNTRDKGKRKQTTETQAHDSGKSSALETTFLNGKEKHQPRAPTQPRCLSRSSTLSSIFSSTFLGGGQRQRRRRRKRERSDARPGYFDSDPSPALKPTRAKTSVVVKDDDGDRLEMNLPVELARTSWSVPVGTAR